MLAKPLLSTRHKLLAVCLAGAGMVGLIGWKNMVGPDVKKLSQLKKQKAEESLKRQVLASVERLRAHVEGYRANLSAPGEISGVIEILNDMAREHNVKITSLSTLDTEKAAFYERTDFKLEADCQYHDLGKFIAKIESHPKRLALSELSAQKGETATSLRVLMTVTVYALRAEGFETGL